MTLCIFLMNTVL